MHVQSTPGLTPFESLLEALHAAQVEGDADREAELRAIVEADLSARERAAGLA